MGYGMPTMLQSQFQFVTKIEEMPFSLVNTSLELNMNLETKETFVYDEIEALELEAMLDSLQFYNDVDVGFRLENFNFLKELTAFVPVATYHEDDKEDRK